MIYIWKESEDPFLYMSEGSTPKNVALYNQVIDRALIVKDAVSIVRYVLFY